MPWMSLAQLEAGHSGWSSAARAIQPKQRDTSNSAGHRAFELLKKKLR